MSRRRNLERLLLAAAGAALGFIACVTVAPTPTPAQLSRAQSSDPALTTAQLDEGRSRFVTRCSACHAAPAPGSLKPEAWPDEVERMAPRAHVTPEQAALITRYLQTVSEP